MRLISSSRTLLSAVAVAAALTFAVGCASPRGSHDRGGEAAESAVLIDLAQADAIVSEQLTEDERPTVAHRLYQQDSVTMHLRHFERGARVPDHAVPGTATAFVLKGRLEITVGDQVHTVSAGQVLVMTPNTTHSVHAVVPSEMLLTIAASR